MIWRWQVELAIIRATIPEWKPFIFSKEIFWPLNFDRTVPLQGIMLPRLSAGRLLLAQRILNIFSEKDPAIQTAVEDDVNQLLELQNDWQSNWGKKINLEIPSRLRQWRQILNDLSSPAGFSNSQYRSQVYVRLLLDILDENQYPPLEYPVKDNLNSMDRALRNETFHSPFVWDTILKDGFPEEQYWYLYRKI